MFEIFSKKNFLIDYLDGFIDIHNHILPGIDDGAKTVEESYNLVVAMGEFGCKKFIATPHIMHNYYPNDIVSISKAQLYLNNELKKNDLNDYHVDIAAEHMIDSNFETLLKNKTFMPLAGSYILVEMSYLQASINFDLAIRKIGEHRFFPILAHPERYMFLQKRYKKYQKYKSNGILFQLNMLSLCEYYGKEVHKTAIKLLEDNLIDFVASDVHNLTHIKTLKEIQLSQKKLDLILPIIEKTKANFA